MEASALHAPVGLTRQRSTIGLAVLRLRSDEQLVALLRAGHEESFQVIHDRYHARLFAYMRQMLSQRQDVEDALQEVFERAYSSLLAGDRELALRPWLYRIAHNRCIDHLRRPVPPPPEAMLQLGSPAFDPIVVVDRREALRRLMDDVRRLPEQQRSALLMRELGGISYAEVAQALGVTVPAVKSLLVRARISLAQAVEARDTACAEIQAELVLAHEGRVRPNAMARRHLRDCSGCREFRGHLRGVRRQLLALGPSVGVCGLVARILGGSGGSSGAAGGGAAAAAGGSAAGLAGGATAIGGGGILASAGALATSAGHVATLIAATVVTAGGAAALQHSIAPVLDPHHTHKPAHVRAATPGTTAASSRVAAATVLAVTGSLSSPTQPAGASTAHSASASSQSGRRLRRMVVGSSNDGLLPTPDPTAPASTVTTAGGGATTGAGGPTGSTTSTAGATTGSGGTGTSTGTSTGSSGPAPGTGSGTSTGSGSSAGTTGGGSGSGTAGSGSGSTGTGTSSGTGSASSGSAGTGTGSTGTGSSGSGQSAGGSGTSGSPISSSSSYPYTT